MSDERADQELITAIAKGDTGCFETLYPAIRNIALTRVRRTSREVLGEVPDRAAPAEPQASDIMGVLLTTSAHAGRRANRLDGGCGWTSGPMRHGGMLMACCTRSSSRPRSSPRRLH